MHALPGADKVLTHLAALLPPLACIRLRDLVSETPESALCSHHPSLCRFTIFHSSCIMQSVCIPSVPEGTYALSFFKWPVTVQDHTVIPISPGNPIPARRQGQTRPSIAANGRMRPHICERRSHHLDISCHFVVVFISAFCVVLFYASPRHRPIVTFPSFLLGYAQRVSSLGNNTVKPFYVCTIHHCRDDRKHMTAEGRT